MIDKGVKPDIQIYTCMIHGYLSTGQWKEVVQRLEEMYARGLDQNVVTYGLLSLQEWKMRRSQEDF
jgi:leucine-rich PPR motif-containing protein